MPSHERCKHKLDGSPVSRGILGYPFKRVDPADSGVDVLAGDLIHGATEPLGDLTFASNVDLPPCGGCADNNECSGENLQ